MEVESTPSPHLPGTIYSSSVPTLSHLDMARPAHEDPEYKKQTQVSALKFVSEIPADSSIQLSKVILKSIFFFRKLLKFGDMTIKRKDASIFL